MALFYLRIIQYHIWSAFLLSCSQCHRQRPHPTLSFFRLEQWSKFWDVRIFWMLLRYMGKILAYKAIGNGLCAAKPLKNHRTRWCPLENLTIASSQKFDHCSSLYLTLCTPREATWATWPSQWPPRWPRWSPQSRAGSPSRCVSSWVPRRTPGPGPARPLFIWSRSPNVRLLQGGVR